MWSIVNAIRLRQTKSFSPEEVVSFADGDLRIKVFYNRPYKKGREIFGGLVPYGKVWRTGANEATVFETNKVITLEGGKKLIPGKYSFWTVPDSSSWQIIFNAQHGQWGVNSKGEANRDPALDVLSISAHAIIQENEFEQFTIQFEKMGEEAEMVLLWDKTVVAIPFSY
ncbi:MAG: DUF2911 domain-containing protein [Cyclobacteriaceae bacterium]|nr:DUF2911 domain-containing protein [Cyclobacteriaceae bacterium]UYN88458.1 MAG: DUF2911 domain-containing protein [Cyclobacteriaceae bacterium]